MKLKFFIILTRISALIVITLTGTTAVVGQAPIANFSGAPLSGCSPMIVSFQDLSTRNPTSWLWDFGNGNTSTLTNPSATYFNPGTYTVSLKVTNSSGSNTLTRTQYITVYESPTVNFSASVRSGCFPLRVQFMDLSTPGSGNTNTSWYWDFGNGASSTLQNPFVVYNSAGTFSVTLKVTNDKGCTKTVSRTNYITVTAGVKAQFTHTQPTVCSAPASITFTNTSTGPPTLSYSWDFGDGNFSGAANPIHTYTANGSYTVTLITSSTAGCMDTFKTAVPIVIGGYTTSFNALDDVCLNDPVVFTNTSTPAPVTSSWIFGDGGTSSVISPTYAYTTPGTYTIWLYNDYSACRDSSSQSITVHPLPTADFMAPVTAKCQPPFTANFQDISGGGAIGWQWDFGDGGTSISQNPSHTYTAYGDYDVTLIITSASGCKDTITKPAYIRVKRATITIPQLPARGCIPFTITPFPQVLSVDIVTSWNWDFGDGGTSTLQSPTHTYIAQGTYTVRLIITTSTGCTDTLTLVDAVHTGSKPIANFSATPIPVCGTQPVFFTDLSTSSAIPPVNEWEWDFGDGYSSGEQNPVHQYADTGYFWITLIAINNGCRDTLIKPNYIYVLPPIARFRGIANCSNRLEFSFVDQSIAPQTWDWNFGDGSPHSFIPNPVHTYPAYGAYSVTLIVTNSNGCADTLTQLVHSIDQSPDFSANKLAICHRDSVVFTAFNYDPSLTPILDWDFGDGNTATVNTPTVTHSYIASGTYTVLLVITDINGCKDSVTKTNYIRVNGPTAAFATTDSTGCTGILTTFNDLSTTDGINTIVNWHWDFGDGTIQDFTGPPYQHIYNAVGVFPVSLKVTDNSGCTDSIALNNLITRTDPTPDFNASQFNCPGSAFTFINVSTPGGFSSNWDFGDGGTSTVTSPVYAYTAPGVYDIKLKIVDTNGCADSLTKTQYITVDVPKADFIPSDTTGSCIPLEIRFTNTSTYYNSLIWDFGPGEGTSIQNDPVHYYATPGIYPVKLVITSPGGCMDSIIKTITVYDTSGARANYVPLAGCKPLIVNLDMFTPGTMASYLWDFGDGNTDTTTTSTNTHVYTSYGNFLPKVIMEDPSGCIIPIAGLDTIIVIGANAKFGYDDSLFCDRGPVNFTDSTTFNDPIVNHSWLFGDGGSSSIQNPSHQYLAPGNYDVSLAILTQNGCRDTITKLNAIKVVQSPLTFIGGDSVICLGQPLLHTGLFLLPDTSQVGWSWNFPNGHTSSFQNPSPQIYISAGTFTVTSMAVNSSGCRDTATKTIYVNPLPVVNMPGQLTVQNGFPVTIPATYSPNTMSWQWSPTQGLSCTNCPTPDAGPKFNTTYIVNFTDNNGCVNNATLEVIVICKNANLFIPNTFSPNGDGSNDRFYPRGKGLERVRSLRIFNRWGEVVFEKREFPVNDPLSGWDGTFKGKKPQADVYVYQVEVFCENGEIIRLNGNIALIL